MKMTRLEWRYLQKIALDHPYFDTHALPLTEKEAKTIVAANIGMTGKEFVDSIYAKLGMARPKEEKKRFAWLRNIGELLTVKPIRRIAIAVLVVLLMTVFFAATPVGKAIAESVIRHIATLIGSDTVIVNYSDKESTLVMIDGNFVFDEQLLANSFQEPEAVEVIYVDSFDAFTEATGREPLVLSLPYSEIFYDYDELIDRLSLQATYEAPKGKIFTCQIWHASDYGSIATEGYTVYGPDPSIYYSVEEDGDLIIFKVFEDSACLIIAEGGYTLNDFLDILVSE